jgi:uncharacterized protein (TIGR02246 family)
MKIPAVAACCLLLSPALVGQSPDQRARDEAAVRDVVRRYVEARERRQAAEIEALFTQDADQYTTAGEWRRGRAAIVPGTLRSSSQNPGTRTIQVESVRFITPDVAIADGPYAITSGGADPRRMWTTIVVAREGGVWKIAAIRNIAPTVPTRAR